MAAGKCGYWRSRAISAEGGRLGEEERLHDLMSHDLIPSTSCLPKPSGKRQRRRTSGRQPQSFLKRRPMLTLAPGVSTAAASCERRIKTSALVQISVKRGRTNQKETFTETCVSGGGGECPPISAPELSCLPWQRSREAEARAARHRHRRSVCLGSLQALWGRRLQRPPV